MAPVVTPVAAQNSPSGAVPPGVSAKSALSDACNALLAAGVRKPYGLGWVTDGDAAAPQGARIDLRPGATPAAGLVLFRAGRMLADNSLTEAAIAVAHGLALCQRETGKIPDEAIFARFPSPHDLEAGARDRASTAAALGLFTEILSSTDEQDARLKSAAIRCMTWLIEQQLRDGAWPTELVTSDPQRPIRVYRLDSPDWRNCTLALMLVGDVLNRPTSTIQAQGACNALIKLQLNDPKATWANGAWGPIYRINSLPLKEGGPAYVVDTLATQRAAQTLLARHLLTQDPAAADALSKTAATMRKLRMKSGEWYRVYALPTSPMLPPTRPTAVASRPAPVIGASAAGQTPTSQPVAATTQPTDPSGLAPAGMAELLAAIEKIEQIGPTKIPHRIVQLQIAATVCGLTDTPFVGGWETEHTPADWQGSWLRLQTEAIYTLLQQMATGNGG